MNTRLSRFVQRAFIQDDNEDDTTTAQKIPTISDTSGFFFEGRWRVHQ